MTPVLKSMSKEIVHLGPTGSGAKMKLINLGVNAAPDPTCSCLFEGELWLLDGVVVHFSQNLWPTHIQRVDFLAADLTSEDRGAIRGDVDGFDPTHFSHSGRIHQARDHFDLVVGES